MTIPTSPAPLHGATAFWPGAADAARFLDILSTAGDVRELRALKLPPRKITAAGYFEHNGSGHARMIAAAAKLDAELAPGVYVTINPVRGDLLARAAERVKYGIETTTSDKDILSRRWLLIDLDPARPSNISSSSVEHESAIQKARDIRAALLAEGWPEPVAIDSGNGAHLLYRIDLPAEDAGLVKRSLAALAARFGDAFVQVDQGVYNPARITKLPGTMARKGDSIESRPHRRSRVLSAPETVATVPLAALEALAATAPAFPVATLGVAAPAANPAGRRGPASGGALPVDRARAYIAATPPAVDGDGGDKATFKAACSLVIGFDLDDATALSLLSEWNAGCQPPWDESKLRAKIEHARKYGKGKRGGLLEKENPRSIASSSPPARRRRPISIDQADIPGSNDAARPKIVITTQVHTVTDSAERALIASPAVELYQRGGQLVRIVRPAGGSPSIRFAPRDHVFELLARAAKWVRVSPGGKEGAPPVEENALPPEWVGRSLCQRSEWSFKKLEGVVEAPTLRRDGTILSAPGYDEASGLIYEPDVDFPPIPESPSLEDARAALLPIVDLIDQFPFVDDLVDRSAALAALLTPLVRYAVDGSCPLFAVRSTTPGSGKSKLVNVASILATGRSARVMTQKKDADEDSKTILSLAMEGARIVLIDNVQAPLGSDALDAALTGQIMQGRVLGQSATASPPLDMIWYATGNNMQVKGDLARRCIPVDLNPECERPEQRDGWKYPDLLAHVQKNRPALVSAALTAIRAYVVAGRPDQSLPAFGSFENWSALVRSALVWIGCADPCAACSRLRKDADPELEAWEIFLETWVRLIGTTPCTVVELLGHAKRLDELRTALAAVDAKSDVDRIDARKLGYVFRKWKGRIVSGRKLVQNGEDRDSTKRWIVETVIK